MLAALRALAMAAAPPAPDPNEQTIDKALAAIRAGNNADALALIDPLATKATADNAQAASEGTQVFCAQSPAEMLIYLAGAAHAGKKAQVVGSRVCTVLFLRAYVLENLQRLPEAVDQLHALIALEPDFPHFQVEYGAALRQSGKMDEALAAYRNAAALAAPNREYDPDHAAALRGVGFVLTEQGDLDGAEAAYRESLTLAPDHPIALRELQYIAQLRKHGVKSKAATIESNLNPAKVTIPDKPAQP